MIMNKVRRANQILVADGLTRLVNSVEQYIFVSLFDISPVIASIFTFIDPVRPCTVLLPTTRGWLVWEIFEDSKFYVPRYEDTHRGTSFFREKKFQRYTLPDFAIPQKDDTVIEVGAFRGEFTREVSPRAKRVISFEPDPYNMWYLLNNVECVENVEVVPFALWNENTRPKFLQGRDPTQSSLINIDAGGSKREIMTQSVRLDELLSNLEIETVDYLKIDAEGAEPEVIEGAKGANIRMIAVDCGPERYGKRTNEEVVSLLQDRGFEIRTTESEIVFGRQ